MNSLIYNKLEFWNNYTFELAIMLLGASIISFCIGYISRSIKVKNLLNLLVSSNNENLYIINQLNIVRETEKNILFENARLIKRKFEKEEEIKTIKNENLKLNQQVVSYKNNLENIKKENQTKIVKFEAKKTNDENVLMNKTNAKLIEINIKKQQQKINLIETSILENLNLKDRFDFDATKNLTAFAKKQDYYNEEVNLSNIAKKIDFSRIGSPDIDNADDLTRLSGIGKNVEYKLNKIGIYNYKQIASFNKNDIDAINEEINFFPERMNLESWKNEALELLIVS